LVGSLVVLEGIDAVGKTTQAALLAKRLEAEGKEVVLTRQPHADFHVFEETLEKLYPGEPSPEADALLFALDKAEHVNKVVKPALAAGKTVVSDRYYPSSIAYQSVFDGLDAQWIKSVNAFAPEPDLFVFMRVTVDVAAARASASGKRRLARFEDFAVQGRVQDVYVELAKAPNWVTVDADGSVDDVAGRVWAAVSRVL